MVLAPSPSLASPPSAPPEPWEDDASSAPMDVVDAAAAVVAEEAREASAAAAFEWTMGQLGASPPALTIPGLITGTLGPFLTHADGRVRGRAVELLASVLERLGGGAAGPSGDDTTTCAHSHSHGHSHSHSHPNPSSHSARLSDNVVTSLVTFFCERLKDFESFLPCVRALASLVATPLPTSPHRRRLVFAPTASPPSAQCLFLRVVHALAAEGARVSAMSQPLRQAYFNLVHSLFTTARTSPEAAAQGVFGEAGGAMAQGNGRAWGGVSVSVSVCVCVSVCV